MARVKRSVNAHKKRREVLEQASGYRGQRSRLYRKAKEQVTHSLVYAYRDRRARKGDFRRLWIQRINAAARAEGMIIYGVLGDVSVAKLFTAGFIPGFLLAACFMPSPWQRNAPELCSGPGSHLR